MTMTDEEPQGSSVRRGANRSEGWARRDRTEKDQRALMFSIAYRMTGSVAEAEDLVQDAFFRLERAWQGGSSSSRRRPIWPRPPPGWPSTTALGGFAGDLCRHLAARADRTDLYDGPEQMAELSDSLSMAFLVLLESLSPVERAVFLLREVFDYPYEDIAQIVERGKPTAGRSSGGHAAPRHPSARHEASAEHGAALLQSFLVAARGGDLDQLVDLLAADAVFYGDGGGKANAIRQPLYGRDQVATFVVALFKQASRLGVNGT